MARHAREARRWPPRWNQTCIHRMGGIEAIEEPRRWTQSWSSMHLWARPSVIAIATPSPVKSQKILYLPTTNQRLQTKVHPGLYQRLGLSSPDGRDAARSVVGIYLLAIAHSKKASTQRTELSCSTTFSLLLFFSLVLFLGLSYTETLARSFLLSLYPLAAFLSEHCLPH